MFAVVAAVTPGVRACQTPVFRYALEKWPGDYYPLLIYHDAPLSPDDQATIDWLEKVQEVEGSQVSIYVLDVSKKPATQPASTQPTTQPEQSRADAQMEYLLKKFPPPTDVKMPAMVLRYPARPGPKGAVWPVVHTGRLDRKVVKSVIDSPARQKIVKRLLSGDSSVWVLLESGDKKKDDAAAKLLKTELARMNEELKLPEQAPTPEDPYEEEGLDIELKVAFTMLRVSRDDPAEAMFIQMLLGSEEGLDEVKDPIAFPIFGRGRALAAFVGEGIDAENIEDASIFLVGKCSCQVKDLNPGTDIMFTVNWEAALAGQPKLTMPALPKIIVNEVDAVDVVLRTIPKKIDPTTQPATQPTTQPSSDPASPDPAPKEEITTSASVIPMSMMLIIGGAAIGLIGLVVVSMVVVMRKGAGS
jgi:hypothetical protein